LLSFAAGLPRGGLIGYPEPEAARSRALVEAAFPGREIIAAAGTNLDDAMWPALGTVCAGVYGDVGILTGHDLTLGQPSALTALVARLAPDRQACAVLMDSTVEWYAFAVWDRGRLTRSFSASHADGVTEEVGEPLPFEPPGATPVERANEALRTYVGFVQEGRWERDGLDPEDLRLERFTFADARARQEALRQQAGRMIRVQPG